MGRDRRFLAAAAALSSLLLVAVPEAWAQQGWGTTPDLLSAVASTGSAISAPRVGVDANGNAVAFWAEPDSASFTTAIKAARLDAASGLWSPPVTLSSGVRIAGAVDVAVDGAGNALAMWATNPISTPYYVHLSRYDATSAQWSPVSLIDNFFFQTGAIAAARNGRSVACWSVSSGVHCLRYAPGSGWEPAEVVSSAIWVEDVAIDTSGNVLVLWTSGTSLQARRFDAGTASWGAVVDLATNLSGNGPAGARLAMNAAGEAIAAWGVTNLLSVARYVPGGTGWTAPTVLSSFGLYNEAPRPAIDGAGRITVAWVNTGFGVGASVPRTIMAARFTGGTWTLPAKLPNQTGYAYGPPGIDVDPAGNVLVTWSQSLASPGIRLLASRYAMSTGQWTTDTDLSAVNQSAYNTDVAMDAAGNAVAVWFQTASGYSVPESLRWRATPAAPAIAGAAPASGALSVDVTLPASVDPSLAPTNLEYSLDGGASWTTRAPASAASPLDLSGLTDGVTHTLAVRSVNTAGTGPASTPVPVRSGLGSVPTDLRVVARTGRTVTLAWVAPAAGLVPTDYLIEGGLAGTSQVLASVPTGGAATQVTFEAPDGAFFARVVGMARAIRLAASPSIQITVNTTTTPAAPVNLLGTASGGTLDLSWTTVWSDAPPTGIRLSVTGALSASVDLALTESFVFPGVPDGTYTFTVAALNGTVASAPSAPVTLTFPGTCGAPPEPPTAFSASTQHGMLYLDWLPPASGAAVLQYTIVATTPTPIAFTTARRSLAVPVPPGTYTVTVASFGPCGTSTATPPQTVVVP